jgi:protein-tyrosine kinase
MEPIRQAIQRAKTAAPAEPQSRTVAGLSQPAVKPVPDEPNRSLTHADLDRTHLQASRIVAHDPADPRSRAFDILRTQVLQSMDRESWRIVAATSPGASCGKTLTAVNLALSIARQSERSVFLVELDLQKPSLTARLGLGCRNGVVGVLEGRTALKDAIIEARIGNNPLLVLPAEMRVQDSSELIASRALRTMLQTIKRDFPAHTIIVDLPPMLTSDDVLSLLPQVDCVLLIAAVGTSTVSEIQQCNKHLQSTPLVRLVLNKSSAPTADYYY